ncbi:MAG: c-type cytochrome [Candidatus Sulfomarinibacteraceae bacterium]
MDPMPVPKDFLLPLPAASADLQLAIVALFLVHIVFVNLMVGGVLLSLAAEIRGLWRRPYDALARKIAATVTVNKSLAVVLGVGPLLVINALYGLYFYTANSLTGRAWIMIVPVVISAFLLLYLHKYSWDALADRKGLHLAIGGAGAVVLLAVPLIFLANVNLMLFPDRWLGVEGFLSAVALPNVVPRFVHFVLASVAVAALFLAGWLCRPGFDFDNELPGLDRFELKRELLTVAFGATALQLLAGPLVLLTLPPHGLSWLLAGTLTVAVGFGAAALVLLWRESSTKGPLSAGYWTVIALLGCTVGLMGVTRHLYRETAITPHRQLVAAHTAAFQSAALGARMRLAAGTPRLGAVDVSASVGERVFRATCMACHDVETRRVGPPLTEIVDLYTGNPDGLIAWVKAPGRKREGFQQMPPITMQDAQYRAVATYILDEVFATPSESG